MLIKILSRLNNLSIDNEQKFELYYTNRIRNKQFSEKQYSDLLNNLGIIHLLTYLTRLIQNL